MLKKFFFTSFSLANASFYMIKIITVVVSLLVISLSACSSFSPISSLPPPPHVINHYMPWVKRKAQLDALTSWHANGNLAARTRQGKGVNASFSWEQTNPTSYQLTLFGPLGTSSAVLTGHPNQVSLALHQRIFTAKNPEQLLQDQLGLRLPVSQLYYWLRALPAPQSRYTVNLDAFNRLLTLRQSGWLITYNRYTNVGNRDLPDQLEITNRDWQIRIAINHWDDL